MSYTINFKPAALRRIQSLSKPIQKRLSQKIETLADNPFPDGVKKLVGKENFYRVRVGEYRITISPYAVEVKKV